MGRFLAEDLGPMPAVEAGAVMRVPRGGGLGVRPDAGVMARLRAA
jgi:hypothetical protein